MVVDDRSSLKPGRAERVRGRRWLRKLTPYLLLLPAAILLGVILIYPLLRTVYMSFWEWPILRPEQIEFVGFQNYIDLFTDDESFLTSLAFTLKFTLACIGLEFFLGLGSALVLEHLRRWRGFVNTIVILPYLVAPIAVGLTWRLVWARDFGLANYASGLVGLSPISWLADTSPAFWATVISEVWRSTPFVTLILLAGLTTIPNELLDASKVDGASPWQVFRRIKLPLLAPSIAIALIFQSIFKLRVFDLIFTLTGGGPGKDTTPLGLMIQRTYFRYFEGGYSAALSVILLLIGAVISVLYMKLVYREVQY